jgi:ketosteroid isomerase-like protein
MSQENVELVRSIFAAWERGEYSSIFAAWERGDYSSIEWADPEIEFVIVEGPTPGTWTGMAGMAEGWSDVLSAWEDPRPHVDEYRELDGERLLVLFRHSGRGKTSGLEIGEAGAKGASLFHVRDGKVTRIVLYFNQGRALADLGLSE